jgi:hypothetical protein
MRPLIQFPPSDRPHSAPNLYVYSIGDARPVFYLSDECDYGFTLDGETAFYIDLSNSSNNVYSLDGRPLYYIEEGYFCDASGTAHYYIGDE